MLIFPIDKGETMSFGIRALIGSDGLEFRMRKREMTGMNVSLNRKKPIPFEVLMNFRKVIRK
jgi:hypothetical protein